ncbi:unnamed protein product, partial [marine sediment metagenome]
DAAIVIILSMWEPGGEPVVDIETIGQEVSSRIG